MRIRGSLLLTALALLGLVAAACRGGATAELPAAAGEGPRVGDPAPAFSLPSAQGRTVSLAESRGRKPVLLYFSMGST
jgi:peroxiredoxin Q/BCP